MLPHYSSIAPSLAQQSDGKRFTYTVYTTHREIERATKLPPPDCVYVELKTVEENNKTHTKKKNVWKRDRENE